MHSDYYAPLCATCQELFASLTQSFKAAEKQIDHKRTQLEVGQAVGPLVLEGPHHRTTKDLSVSAAMGCGICFQLNEGLRNWGGNRSYVEAASGHHWLKCVLFYHTTVNEFSLSFEEESSEAVLGRFDARPFDTGSDMKEKYVRHLAYSNTGDGMVIDMARSWLYDCLANHTCSTVHSEQRYYPPRLLKLDEDSVQLIDTDQSQLSGQYATLSYCWGRNPRHLTLTSYNIDTLRSGFSPEHLAKTFREAIEVTTLLGLQLLWIDALCILQSGEGSREDWQRHVTEMGVIYANCVLNIAADHAQDAEAGLFVSRDPDTIRPCVFDALPIIGGSPRSTHERDDPYVGNTYQLVDWSFWYSLLSDAALTRRGWVHQERLLSPRILHFGNRQLVWECTAQLACETFPFRNDNVYRKAILPFDFLGDPSRQWYDIVTAYSAASLTNLQDRLPAIAGIAKRVSLDRAATYVGGLFLEDMPKALLWRYDGGPLGGNVTPYRAPSWSWASREGKVFFYWTGGEPEGGVLASVEEIDLKFVDRRNHFGHLEGGLMKISAPMICIASLNRGQFPRGLYAEFHERGWNGEHYTRGWGLSCELALPRSAFAVHPQVLSSVHGDFFFDESALVRPRSETSIAFLAFDSPNLYGLLVAPLETSAKPQRWVRVGVCSIKGGHDLTRGNTSLADVVGSLKKYPKTTIELV